MSTTLNFKDIIDLPTWRPETPALGNSALGTSMAYDLRNDASRCSNIYMLRTNNIMDLFDPTTGEWLALAAPGLDKALAVGTCGAYDGATMNGRFIYLNLSATQRMLRFDCKNRVLDSNTYLRFPQGAAVIGCKLSTALFVDGTTKVCILYHLTNTQSQMFSLLIQR